MKVVSLFAGIGGFDLALKRLGHQIVFANEWDKYAAQIYEKNFNHKPDTRDIRTVSTSEIPEHDLLVGGFPCQAFSVAGKRLGFNDTRGTLFFEIARILRDKKPSYLLLENVRGLLSHEGGRTFKTIIEVLTDLGYIVQWSICNSKDAGVPQNRERIIIVGSLRGQPIPEVFSLSGASAQDIEARSDQKGICASTLTARQFSNWNGNYIQQLNPDARHSRHRVYGINGISPTLNTMQGGDRQPKIAIPVMAPDRGEKKQNGRRIKEDGDPSFTLTSQDRHGVTDGFTVRRLTPLECERLQGFPDGWTEGISETQRYKTLGNAVTVNVIESIAARLSQ